MSLHERLRHAMDTRNADDYIRRVKEVISAELHGLDPAAKIVDTKYFNHTAIPDFEVTWDGGKENRQVFLRGSYLSIDALRDTAFLRDVRPMLLALDPGDPDPARFIDQLADNLPQRASEVGVEEPQKELDAAVNENPEGELVGDSDTGASNSELLVTDSSAIEALQAGDDASTSPVTALVRSQFIRGGKGHVREEQARQLVQLDATQIGFDDGSSEVISEFFTSRSALVIGRANTLLRLAATRESTAESEAAWAEITGLLDRGELMELLPWLLAEDSAVDNRYFWRNIGELVSFKDLEDIRENLRLSPVHSLVSSNTDRWIAKWGYSGLIVPSLESTEAVPISAGEDDEGVDEALVEEMPVDDDASMEWTFKQGRLSIDLIESRLHLAFSGKLMNSRPGASSVRWSDVADRLAGYRVLGASLSGVERSFSIDARQSANIVADISSTTESLRDTYFVDLLTVARSDSDDGAEIEIDFRKGTAHARQGAPIEEISLTVVDFLSPEREEAREAFGDAMWGNPAE